MRDCLAAPQGMYVMPGWHKPRECPSLNPLLARNKRKPADCESGNEPGFLVLNPGFFCVKNCEWMNESTAFFPCINAGACKNISYVPYGGTYNSSVSEGRFNYSVVCETGYTGILCKLEWKMGLENGALATILCRLCTYQFNWCSLHARSTGQAELAQRAMVKPRLLPSLRAQFAPTLRSTSLL